MKLNVLQFFAVAHLVRANLKREPPAKGPNLPPDAPLGIEVFQRAPDGCTNGATDGDLVSVHYTGWTIIDSKQFDSSVSRGKPFSFTLGANQVIKGWEEGVKGACVGEGRRLTIPSDKAYGDFGYPPIIGKKATLVFDVNVEAIERKGEL